MPQGQENYLSPGDQPAGPTTASGKAPLVSSDNNRDGCESNSPPLRVVSHGPGGPEPTTIFADPSGPSGNIVCHGAAVSAAADDHWADGASSGGFPYKSSPDGGGPVGVLPVELRCKDLTCMSHCIRPAQNTCLDPQYAEALW